MCTQNRPNHMRGCNLRCHLAVLPYDTRNGCQAQPFRWASFSTARCPLPVAAAQTP